jgi:hypothetical protein
MGALLACSAAGGAEYAFFTPSDDRWQYPFNFSPGRRAFASAFGSTSDPEYTTFNDRDGIVLIGWRTDAQIPTGLPLRSYDLRGVEVTLTCPSGATWIVDLSPDPWFNLDYPIADADPGQPLELFGVGFGPDFTAQTWTELSPYVGGDDQAWQERDPYPFVFGGDPLAPVHVEDSVRDQFTPMPWAIGLPSGYTPGNQRTPFPVHFQVDLALSEGRVRDYFQAQLSAGRVVTAVTSLAVTFQQAASGFPTFYTKEGAALDPHGRAPELRITAVPTGDVDGDGRRALDDYRTLRNCLSGPQRIPAPTAPTTVLGCLFLFDFDDDDDVDAEDVGEFSRRFTGGG